MVFDDDKLDLLRSQEDIYVVSPILERTLSLGDKYKMSTNEGDYIEKIIVNGWDPKTSKKALPLNLDSGRWIQEGDEKVILARRSFLDKVGLELGDSVTLPSANGAVVFEIIGTLPKHLLLVKKKCICH